VKPHDTTPRLSPITKALYSTGAIASAVKQRSMTTFLMLFYNQVVGLPPRRVGAILMITLIFDAFIDPVIGQTSDNFRSRLGRRHPFIYAAALPYAAAFFLLWNPPLAWSKLSISIWLLTCLLAVRLFDACFELPSTALLPELTSNYHERTGLIALRMMLGALGGLGMIIAAYQVFLKESPGGGGGVLSRGGYFAFSTTAAGVIFTSILISAAGTHRRIRHLTVAPARKITFGRMMREVMETLNNRGFVSLAVAGIFISIAAGSRNSLEIYMSLYFWDFTQTQLSTLTGVGVAASFAGVLVAPVISKRIGKKSGAVAMYAVVILAGNLPVALRLAGWLWQNRTPQLFDFIMVEQFVSGTLTIATLAILASMLADVVEDAEVKTGRRSEGLLFSADNLVKNIISGVAVLVAGVVLSLVSFPANAQRGHVPADVLHRLASLYLGLASFHLIAMVSLLFYGIDQGKHESNLETLKVRRDRMTGGADLQPVADLADASAIELAATAVEEVAP
jgi:Na+/melibiose symporter-like transporter